MTKRPLAALIVILLLGTMAACASKNQDIVAAADSAIPMDTLQDWVTYGDYLVEFVVVSEERIPPPKEELDRGEGTIGRRITIELSKPFWSRPTLRDGLKAPSTIVTGGGFWAFHGKTEQRVRIDDHDWLAVNSRYLAILSYIDEEYAVNPQKSPSSASPHWGPLTYMSYAEGVIRSTSAPQLRDTVIGKTGDQLAAILATTQSDPDAAPYMWEDPALRYQHVAAKR
jgi:hypothetical protein